MEKREKKPINTDMIFGLWPIKEAIKAGKTFDKLFVQKLYRKVILSDEDLIKIIREKSKSWDYDRIPMLDVILLKMAIIELKEMPTIPVKVTLNEYIELAKYFSTPKSKTFINGVLDKLIVEFKSQGAIKKTGRGLIE